VIRAHCFWTGFDGPINPKVGASGIRHRWTRYASTAHGSNAELKAIVNGSGLERARSFRFSILEIADIHTGEADVLAFLTFPKEHRSQLHSTNPLERLNKEVKRRTHVVGIFPNEAAIVRLVGALMLEQNDEWAVTRRYMSLETVTQVCEDQTIDVARIAAL
jgi:hypothetical protein